DHLGVPSIGKVDQKFQIDIPVVFSAEHRQGFRLGKQGVFRCVKLPTAFVSAPAPFSVHFNRGVSDLPGKPGDPLVQLSVQHDSRSDADSDADVDEVGGFPSGSVQFFSQGPRVGFVVDPNGHLELAVDHPFEVDIFPSQVGSEQDGSVVSDNAGDADADPDDAVGAGRGLVEDRPKVFFQKGEDLVVGQILVKGHSFEDDVSLQVGQHRQQVVDAQVDADGVPGRLVEHEHDGTSPA